VPIVGEFAATRFHTSNVQFVPGDFNGGAVRVRDLGGAVQRIIRAFDGIAFRVGETGGVALRIIGVGERRTSGRIEHFDQLSGFVVYILRGGARRVGAARELSGGVYACYSTMTALPSTSQIFVLPKMIALSVVSSLTFLFSGRSRTFLTDAMTCSLG